MYTFKLKMVKWNGKVGYNLNQFLKNVISYL